jgi:site-specific recombinase XerD/ribosomal protein L40E
MRDLYNFAGRFELAKVKLEGSQVSAENKDLIFKFIEYKQAQGTGLARCTKYVYILKNFAEGEYAKTKSMKKDRSETQTVRDFRELGKEDVQREFAKLEMSDLSESTKRDYKLFVRIFVGWVFHEKSGSQEPYDPKEHGYPAIFKGIKVKEPGETVKASDLLTDVEKQRIIDVAKNLRDKALVGCLDESGMRPGELLSLQVGNVNIEEQYGELSLDGKTGIRPVFIIRNLAYLVQWLDSYGRKDLNAPLWPDFEKPGEPLSYAGLRQMLKRLAVRAKVKKRVYPYIFRHSEATSDCQEITEPVMRKLYGWSKTSKTPARYQHLSGKDARLARLKQSGLIVEEDKKLVRLCPRCKKPNPATATMCHACGSVLSLRTAAEIQEDRDKLRKEVEELKATVNILVTAHMKPGQSREDVRADIASQKRLLKKWEDEGLVIDR